MCVALTFSKVKKETPLQSVGVPEVPLGENKCRAERNHSILITWSVFFCSFLFRKKKKTSGPMRVVLTFPEVIRKHHFKGEEL